MSNLSVLKTLVLASAALIGLTSCEKDKALTVDDVTGTYSGQMTVSVGDTPGEPANDEIIISKVSDNAVSLKIEDFSFMTFNVGDVTLSNCTLTPAGEDKLYPQRQRDPHILARLSHESVCVNNSQSNHNIRHHRCLNRILGPQYRS